MSETQKADTPAETETADAAPTAKSTTKAVKVPADAVMTPDGKHVWIVPNTAAGADLKAFSPCPVSPERALAICGQGAARFATGQDLALAGKGSRV